MAIRRHHGLCGIIVVLAVSACVRAAGETIEEQPPPSGCRLVELRQETAPASTPAASVFPPLQLEISTPFEPMHSRVPAAPI